MTSRKKRSRTRPTCPTLWTWLTVAALLCTSHAWAGQKKATTKGPLLPEALIHTKARYMVQVGTYSTVQGLIDGYYGIPEKLRPRALVCRSGSYYTLRCGAFINKGKVDALFKQFKEMGLEPIVVKADPSTCQTAKTFLASRGNNTASLTSLAAPGRGLSASRATGKAGDRPYSDLSDPRVRRLIPPGGVRVLPEATTRVVLSNRDINRITCAEGPIKDIIYSKEKGITVKTEGNDAFVKFLIPTDPMTGELKYATAPSEFYVVCGKDSVVYTLIALPRNVPAQAVQLTSLKKNIKKNISLFEGLPFERKVLLMVKAAFRDEIPDSFTVKHLNRSLDLFRYISVILRKEVKADGEGLVLKEYVLLLKDSYPGTQRRVEEKQFLLPELTHNPVGISLEKLILRKGRPSRLFIVERDLAQEGM